jgi:ubiquinone/menaquinone biosynthesis C-methylase UbiE
MAQRQPQWQQFAGSIAENYQRHLVPTIFEPWADDLVDLAAPQLGERVLDVACGPGVVARLAARRAGAGQVTGLDINQGMVEVARSLSSDLAISWEEGSALQMPFPDEAFDLVLCQQGVQFFPDRAAGLQEMRRVLLPGGRVAVAVWGPIEQSPGFAALAAALERHVSPAAAAAARSPFSLPGIEELRDLVEGAGLSNAEVHSRTKMLRFPQPAEFVAQYVWGSPIGAALGDSDRSVLEPVVREVAEALASYVDDRVLSFPIENHLAQAVRPSPTADG